MDMRRILKRLGNRNNKGMSIVTVIVAIGFVAILVSILMMTSVINFKMKSVNVYAKDSFYSAEQVLDEIIVGLQRTVSDGLSYAYTDVITNYNSEDMSAADKNNLVRTKYYEYLWKELGGGTVLSEKDPSTNKTIYKYIAQDNSDFTKGLYGLLNPATQWDTTNLYGAFLRAGADDSFNGVIMTYEKSGIVLKDLKVYYKDSNGFVSAIKTDIRLGYPEFSFSSNDIPNITGYTFITDTAFVQENAGLTTIKGDTYAYAMDIKGNTIENAKVDGVSDTHIVATGFNIDGGKLTTNNSSVLWSGDIEARSSNVTLSGQTYVADDLNIKGRDSYIALRGYYTGFGNSVNNSKESSAILVNGVNTTIDLSAVNKLSLAGRGYIGTSDNKTNPDRNVGRVSEDSNEHNTDGSDIYTGESIAVKSNQLMYLIPGECIGVIKDGSGNPTNKSKYGKNPLTMAEYKLITGQTADPDGNTYQEVSATVPLRKLGGTDAVENTENLGKYVKTNAAGEPVVEKVFMLTADGSSRLVYYYMTFKDDESANNYFGTYYGANKDAVNKYLNIYLKALKLPDEGMTTLHLDMAGLAVSGSRDNKDYAISSNTRLPSDYDYDGLSNVYEAYSEETERYRKQFLGYCSKLTSDYDTIADSATTDKPRVTFPIYDYENNKIIVPIGDDPVTNDSYYTVFKNLINEEILKEVVGGDNKTMTIHGKDGDAFLAYYTNVDANVAIPSGCSLVIANCNVSLGSGSYKGLILSKGKITANNANLSLEADPSAVSDALLLETDDGVYKVSDVFKDTDESDYTAALKGTGKTVTSADLVTYENWTKNVNIK